MAHLRPNLQTQSGSSTCSCSCSPQPAARARAPARPQKRLAPGSRLALRHARAKQCSWPEQEGGQRGRGSTRHGLRARGGGGVWCSGVLMLIADCTPVMPVASGPPPPPGPARPGDVFSSPRHALCSALRSWCVVRPSPAGACRRAFAFRRKPRPGTAFAAALQTRCLRYSGAAGFGSNHVEHRGAVKPLPVA
jgi:hypothetical protein